MRDRIIDCQAGTKVWREYTEEEVAARLVEEARFEERERREKIAKAKGRLPGAMANLKHAKKLKAEGFFSDDDVKGCQRRVDELKAEIS